MLRSVAAATMRLEVYPNPSPDGRLHILADAGGRADAFLAVYDLMGKKILETRALPPAGPIEIGGLRSGWYYVVLDVSGKRIGKMTMVGFGGSCPPSTNQREWDNQRVALPEA